MSLGAQLAQSASVVRLHPFLGESALMVVAEDVDECLVSPRPIVARRLAQLGFALEMLEGLPDVVRRYFELDPDDVDAFVSLFGDDATVVDEGKTYHGLGEVRAWRAGPAIKYTYTTELLDHEDQSAGRHLVTARLTGDFPGETVDLRCEFAVTRDHISRLVIAP